MPLLVANVVGEVLIVVTGGVVRLTGSGLGCPTWPECVPGSFTPVPHQEEGFHKYIEFGNRTLTFLVAVLAVAALWAVWTRWPRRRPLHWLAGGVILGVPAQAVVGGISVLTDLNPFVVGLHFLVSMAMVAAATLVARGAADGDGGMRRPLVPPLVTRLAWVTAVVGLVVVVLGILVTGSGPHSGDAEHPVRTGFDPRSVAWLHADTVMLFCGLVIAMLVATSLTADARRPRRAWRTVLVVTLLQGVIGYVQYFTGLPEVLVALHMLGASLLVVAVTLGIAALWANPLGGSGGPGGPHGAHDEPAAETSGGLELAQPSTGR